jgi:hypothetical protein
LTPTGRHTGYQDPPALVLQDHVELNNELERTAIALHRMTFATPEDVAGMFGGEHGRQELAETWAKTEPATRRLYRLRADVILTVYRGEQR